MRLPFLLFGIGCTLLGQAQTIPQSEIQNLLWRCIGPHRGGRTVGAVGIPSQANVFYIGVNNGGVWKTTDAGRTWKPIFDDQPTGSIGAIDLCVSKPEVIYVGSGEGLQRPDLSVGDGMFKSTDAGKTWSYLGLKDAKQISSVAVDPKNPDRAFAAVLGHPYGPNETRGLFRTLDGGKTWQRILYKDVDTGAVHVVLDPKNRNTLYCVLWSSRLGPWENGQWQGPGSGLFKSTDGGNSWQKLGNGLPQFSDGLGRIGIGISPSNPSRIYATVDANAQSGGIYRSDNAGKTWSKLSDDQRLWGRGSDFAEIKVHPKDPDIVYIGNTSSYKSSDGGKTWVAWKGAPGGDDYHTIWINPLNPDVILMAADQGATITVNAGETWSSWYNQPTAQFYHVITDNDFPYNVYGGQQESGTVGIASRGKLGSITYRDWQPSGGDEYAYMAPDPLNSRYVYGGKVVRFDRITGETVNVAPQEFRDRQLRALRTAPLIFSPVDKRALYFATNKIFKTRDGGTTWQAVSPDLSRERPDVPENIGVFRTAEMTTMARRGVVYALGLSYINVDTLWAGTDDGLVHRTTDGGKSWSNVTPPEIKSWSKVSQIDAGRFSDQTAYISINAMRLNDYQPWIFKTHDGGKSWQKIVNGIPDDEPVQTVREDPYRKGLLFCGTEKTVYFSLDDGAHWTPIRRNLPCSSVRDLVIHENDLVIGTHGRSFWILDDMSQIRSLFDAQRANTPWLYAVQNTYRVAWNLNTDTPLPPEEPAGQNPPEGAIINYRLPKDAQLVTLEIFDSNRDLVRKYSSNDKPDTFVDRQNPYPDYWKRLFQPLGRSAGAHRFIWDQFHTPPEGPKRLPMTAILQNTPAVPRGKWAEVGEYMVVLTVDGHSSRQTLKILPDPRSANVK